MIMNNILESDLMLCEFYNVLILCITHSMSLCDRAVTMSRDERLQQGDFYSFIVVPKSFIYYK